MRADRISAHALLMGVPHSKAPAATGTLNYELQRQGPAAAASDYGWLQWQLQLQLSAVHAGVVLVTI